MNGLALQLFVDWTVGQSSLVHKHIGDLLQLYLQIAWLAPLIFEIAGQMFQIFQC
ncbi:hypothetical protein B4064_3134 [Caldibacillus thermoamylovorans]|nr:hypothetical protein B4064_3134 [Caldibacillus thermoamylovorans]